jgi:CheY-like chemotaxis protein
MPGLSGYDVLTHIKADPATRDIPVAVVTSADLSAQQRLQIEGQAFAMMNKVDLSAKAIDNVLAAAMEPASVQARVKSQII